jgi:hypothetical protein
MKWFFALNHGGGGEEFERYSDLVKVAVHSAQRFTKLAPHCLFDGPDCELTGWLARRGVVILRRRTFLYDRLRDIARQRNDPRALTIGAGAFLRAELPVLAAQAGIADQFVLYTDVDVIFLNEGVDELGELRPKFFAVGPEFYRDDYDRMNTGVMVMNLATLREFDQRFREMIVLNLEQLCRDTWDQTAYRYFFRTESGQPLWDRLDPRFNWKPYWGSVPDIHIIHFHGPKPQHQALLQGPAVAEQWKSLVPLAGGVYAEACKVWRDLLAESR